MLVASTGEVYGRARRVPTPEDEPLEPRSPYAASKAAAEIACDQARRAGLDVVVARAFQHEGPGPGRAVRGRLVGGADRPRRRSRRRHGARRRPLGEARHHRRAGRLPRVRAPARALRPSRHVQRRRRQDGRDARGARAPRRPARTRRSRSSPTRLAARPADLPVVCGDASRLRDATGWEPMIPLEQTLADTLDAARRATTRMASA